MTRRLARGDTLVLATHNSGKLRELADLLDPFGIKTVAARALNLPEPEETEPDFAGNARLKAVAAATVARLPALADDSGLVVPALDGAPGIYSARWAGPSKDFSIAMQRVQTALGGNPDRRAAFVCALAVAWPDGGLRSFDGQVDGTLVWPPRGDRGFGYDAMFLPDGSALTFGEMAPDAKHAVSHRAIAFRRLVDGMLAAR